MSNLQMVWTKHLKDQKKKQDFELALRNDTLVLGRLQEILEERFKDLEYQEMKMEDYHNPSWAYKQAHQNGYKAGLNFVKDLLKFLD